MSSVEDLQRASSLDGSNLFRQLDRLSSELVECRSVAPPVETNDSATVFRQLDRMSSELKHERNLRENAIESARKSLRDRERLVAQIRTVHARATAITDVQMSPRTAAAQLRDTMDSLKSLIPEASLDADSEVLSSVSRNRRCNNLTEHSESSSPQDQFADVLVHPGTPSAKVEAGGATQIVSPRVPTTHFPDGSSPQIESPDVVSVAAASAAAAVARSVRDASPSVAAAEARRLSRYSSPSCERMSNNLLHPATPQARVDDMAPTRNTSIGVHEGSPQVRSPQVSSPDMELVAAAAAAAAVARSIRTASPSVAAAQARRLVAPKAATPRPASVRAASPSFISASRPPIAVQQVVEPPELSGDDGVSTAIAAAAQARVAAARVREIYCEPAPEPLPYDLAEQLGAIALDSNSVVSNTLTDAALDSGKIKQHSQSVEHALQNLKRNLTDEMGESDLSRLLPAVGEWSSKMPHCFLCANAFSLLNRRHHCRKCGHCVCASCSPFRLQLKVALEPPSTPMQLLRSLTPQGQRHSSCDSSPVVSDNLRNAPALQPQAHRVCLACHGAMAQIGKGEVGSVARERLAPTSRKSSTVMAAEAGA